MSRACAQQRMHARCPGAPSCVASFPACASERHTYTSAYAAAAASSPHALPLLRRRRALARRLRRRGSGSGAQRRHRRLQRALLPSAQLLALRLDPRSRRAQLRRRHTGQPQRADCQRPRRQQRRRRWRRRQLARNIPMRYCRAAAPAPRASSARRRTGRSQHAPQQREVAVKASGSAQALAELLLEHLRRQHRILLTRRPACFAAHRSIAAPCPGCIALKVAR